MPSLSIIVPSAGTRSLKHCLASFADQLVLGDQVIVDCAPGVPDVAVTHALPRGGVDWGYTARQRAMGDAHGEYVMFIDDDDGYAPDALAVVRAAIEATSEPRVHLFRLGFGWDGNPEFPRGSVLWKDRVVRDGNVSTQMIVAPNVPERLGRWGRRYAGDADFVMETVALQPFGPVWHEEVICWTNVFRDKR